MAVDSYFARPDATIAYRFTGAGAPLGYAHDVLHSRAAVRGMDLFDFDALAAGRRMLTYDQRGHGQSSGRAIAEDYLVENFARDLLALMDALGVTEPIDFAGSSLGCDTALRAAIAAPDRFRRLVLMTPPVAWSSEAAQQWASAPPPPIFADYPNFTFDPDVAEELLPSILSGLGMSDLPTPDAIATLRHPTLILAWETDPLHPVSTAERLRDLIPGAQLHVSTSVADIKTWTGRIADFVG